MTSIGEAAFCDCSSLTSVTIPDSVTSIGNYAFTYCSSLTSVTIPDSVTSIGSGTFWYCDNLISITLPDGLTSIGSDAFTGCGNLINVVIPESVTEIGHDAFKSCSKLISVEIPEGVTTINEQTFAYCSSLTSVTIPASVTYIDYSAFYNCSSLESVTIPDSVTSIGTSAFSGCSSLTSVYITDLEAWCNIKFSASANPLGNGANLYLNGSLVTDLVIPNDVTSIGSYAFNGCSSLTSIVIPNSVTSIGDYAFNGCSSLENITIPKSVTSIGENAFSECSSLVNTYISDLTAWCNIKLYNASANPLSNGGSLYLNNNLITQLIIPKSVTSIKFGTFYGCKSITSVTIPDSVTTIEKNAFSGCGNIESITIGSGITSIDNELFKYCENAKIYVSDLKSYLNNFSDNPRVELKIDSLPNDLVIPDGVTSIKSFAFKGHNNLTSVTIPDSVTSIGENAFSDCNNIKTLIVGNGLTSLDNLPITSALKFITIGSGINSINENAFNLCNDLTIFKVDENNQNYSASEDKKILFNKDKTTLIAYPSAAGDITIPDGVTTIASNAFSGCSNLTSVTIPDSITSIENKAFEGCNSLTSVTFKDANNWFYTTSSNYTDKMQIDVADTAQNATYLKDTYCNYYWYKYLETTITVTADNVTDGISKLSKGGNHTVKVTGEITADTISSIKTALNNNNSAKVNLDLSDTTGLTFIGENAFSGCSNLTSVTIPDSITSVDYNAFLICNNIENLVTGNGLTSLDNLPITSALKSITIGSGINSINERTFNSCNNLTIFKVDENNQNYSVSEDGKILFNKDKTTLITCSSAANDVTIPDSVTTVNSGAFVNCKNVETLVIGNGLTSLDNLPITSALKSITIGNNIKSIGYNTFKGCNKLASVTIGNRVTSIDDNAFRDCSSLTSVTIPDSVTSIGENAFYNCSNLTNVTIPESVTSIGDGAFYGCESLTSVTFEDIKNWSVVISSGKKKKMNVKNVSKNATNLTQNYCGNEWIKE